MNLGLLGQPFMSRFAFVVQDLLSSSYNKLDTKEPRRIMIMNI